MAVTLPLMAPDAVPYGPQTSDAEIPTARLTHLAVPAVPLIERQDSVALPSLSVVSRVTLRSAPALPSSVPISSSGSNLR